MTKKDWKEINNRKSRRHAQVGLEIEEKIALFLQNAVDGQENPLTVFMAAKLHTAANQKHLTLWGYVADPLTFVVAKEVWASWTPEDQEAVRKAAIQAARENVEDAREGLMPQEYALLKEIEGLGVNLARLSDAEKAEFKKATKQVYDKWAKQIGPELVKKAEESIAARK